MPHISASDRREQFIASAFAIIADEGVSRATTRRVAEIAGAPAASVHYAFSTMDELLRATFEAGTVEGLEVFEGAVQVGGGVAACADALFRECFSWFKHSRSVQLAQWDLILWAIRNHADDGLARGLYRRYVDTTAGLLARAAGPDEQHLDTAELARMVVAFMDGVAWQWLADDHVDLDRMATVAGAMVSAFCAAQAELESGAVSTPAGT